MSQQYVYDIKLSTGIAPKSLDPEGFPLVETKYIETAEGHRLSDKLTALDNQLLVNDQKIDAESIKLQNKIDANKDEVDGEISGINGHLIQIDTNLAQEVTDRVNFGHAVNNELLKVNTRIDGIDAVVGDVSTAIESTKSECKSYTDNKVTSEELENLREELADLRAGLYQRRENIRGDTILCQQIVCEITLCRIQHSAGGGDGILGAHFAGQEVVEQVRREEQLVCILHIHRIFLERCEQLEDHGHPVHDPSTPRRMATGARSTSSRSPTLLWHTPGFARSAA